MQEDQWKDSNLSTSEFSGIQNSDTADRNSEINSTKDLSLARLESDSQQNLDISSNSNTNCTLDTNQLGTEVNDQINQENNTNVIKRHKSTNSQAFINLFKAFIGVGILGIPYSFQQTGYLLSMFVLIFIGAVIYYTTHLIIQMANSIKKDIVTWKDILEPTLGKTGYQIYNFFLVTYIVGCCAAYVIFFTQFFETAFEQSDNLGNRVIFLALSLFLIIPMTFIKHFHFFHKFSIVGNILMLLSLAVLFEYLCEQANQPENIYKNSSNLANFSRLPALIGISIFAFESIGSIINIRNSMKKPKNFIHSFLIIQVIVCIMTIMISIMACIALGNQTEQIVLSKLEKKRSYFLLFQAAYAIALVISYPLQLFTAMKVIESIPIIKRFINQSQNTMISYSPRVFITILIALIALMIPKLASFLNLVGSFAGTAIQFVFPILSYHIFFRGSHSKLTLLTNMFCIIFGIVGGTFAIIDSIKEIISY